MAAVNQTARVNTDAWVRRFEPRPEAGTRLFCLPHAGGSAPFFYPFSHQLPRGVEVLAIQYPGRQDRRVEPFATDLHALADDIADAVLPWTDLPFSLFGHSMGAVLSFEVALRLEDRGIEPRLLFASGHRAPSRPRLESFDLDDDRQLIADLRQAGTAPQLLDDPEVLATILPVLRGDYRASLAYRYREGQRVHCPIVALAGTDDPHVNLDEAASWARHTTADFGMEVFTGDHFFVNGQRAAVLDLVGSRLGLGGAF
ncbi:thioesterase II family protein [Streptomyces sp. NPDC002521]